MKSTSCKVPGTTGSLGCGVRPWEWTFLEHPAELERDRSAARDDDEATEKCSF
jgi:hypothetical protein